MEDMKDWIKAGKIAAEVLDYGCGMVKSGISLLEVTDKIENKIEKSGGKCAFPVQFSINDLAAHYTASFDDKTKFKKGDLVKLDVGVHVNGAIGDNARTIDLGNNKKIVDASLDALNEVIKLVREGKNSGIFMIVSDKNIRDNISREVLNFINEEYSTLPFCKRQLLNHFSEFKVNFALRNLTKNEIIREYNQLPEASGGTVSQAEHTVLVEIDGCKILTRC